MRGRLARRAASTAPPSRSPWGGKSHPPPVPPAAAPPLRSLVRYAVSGASTMADATPNRFHTKYTGIPITTMMSPGQV